MKIGDLVVYIQEGSGCDAIIGQTYEITYSGFGGVTLRVLKSSSFTNPSLLSPNCSTSQVRHEFSDWFKEI